MKIAVAYKWAADPSEASVSPDGQVDFSRAKPKISEYDAVAIAMGRALADAAGAELVGISAGGSAAATPLALKAALSRGLDSAVVVQSPDLESAGTFQTAQALAAAVRHLGDVTLVVCGDSSIDAGAQMVPAVLGGLLGWPALTDVGAAQLAAADNRLTAERSIAEGIQTLVATLPIVISAAAGALAAPAPGMKDILAAAKKPSQVLSPADLSLELAAAAPVTAQVKVSGPARRCVQIDTTDPATAAAELLAALAAAGTPIGGRS
ncbi:MAG: hypothetical protein LBH68_03555 [Bifidobacteriaceae bacterium]|jgi:electron transfer flavoprotein beta subunit|nr:hypothetical protein [Bifidobacteriaceae bacterium]